MAPSWKFRFDGRILFIGYGSVTRCTLPLIERHFDMPLSRVTVIDAVPAVALEPAGELALVADLAQELDAAREVGLGDGRLAGSRQALDGLLVVELGGAHEDLGERE